MSVVVLIVALGLIGLVPVLWYVKKTDLKNLSEETLQKLEGFRPRKSIRQGFEMVPVKLLLLKKHCGKQMVKMIPMEVVGKCPEHGKHYRRAQSVKDGMPVFVCQTCLSSLEIKIN